MTLDKLDIDKCAVIINLNCKGDLRRRLLDLGLVIINCFIMRTGLITCVQALLSSES